MRRKTRILGAVMAALLVAGIATAGFVAAQEDGEPTPSPARIEKREAFLGKVAANLGVTTEQLTQAFKDAELQTVDELLAAGTIDEARAGKLRERINNREGLGLGHLLGGGHGKGHAHGGPGNGRGLGQFIKPGREFLESAPNALGMERLALTDELRGGKSVAEVATERGMNLDDVKAQIIGDSEAKLTQAVENGRITQARADEMLAKLTEKVDDFLNKKIAAESPDSD